MPPGPHTVPELESLDVGLVASCDAVEDLSGDLRVDNDDPCNPSLDIHVELRCRAVEVFADGFESGDTSAWSETAGAP